MISHVSADQWFILYLVIGFPLGVVLATVAYIGTQREQINVYLTAYVLSTYAPYEFHHGDCIGVDAFAHDVAYDLGYYIFVHPPSDPKFRAFKGARSDPRIKILEPRYYLDRNH